jgi:nitroreductase
MSDAVKRVYLKWVEYHIPRFFHRGRLLPVLYYSLMSPAFRRELRAVMAGKIRHLDQTHRNDGNRYLLVRNTHRLEKGLIMRPRRAVFATDFIEETVAAYDTLVHETDPRPDQQIRWFTDVLHSYFDVADPTHPVIARSKTCFESALQDSAVMSPSGTRVPYLRIEQPSAGVSFEAFHQLTRQRKSVRWFRHEAVPRHLIDQALLAAGLAPSACNRQPYVFRIFDDPAKVAELAAIPMGTRGFAHNIPMFVVIVGQLDAYFDERDRHVMYVDGSLAAMTFMLALETLGLSSCPINWPDIESRERRMDAALNLNPHERPILCMAVGYADPDGMVAFSEKRPIDQVRAYNA